MHTSNDPQIPYSVLDLATVLEGKTPADSFKNSIDLARHVEGWGYHRYWLAEHHNMASVASSATAVLIGYIAAGTSTIRVGSGGIMLPNHAPLIVAEQFGTLASIYPGRIDLGLGRAPGTDQVTAMAIRGENMYAAAHSFPKDVQTLQTLFSASNSNAKVRAIPGEGLDIPIWILGSSTDSAHLAANMGLPYAFASHFAPAQFNDAIAIYRKNFQPSAQLQKPYVLACVNVVAADTDAEANLLASSVKRLFLGIITGQRKPLQPPMDLSAIWGPQEEAATQQMLAYSFIGGPEKISKEIKTFLRRTGVNELMATSHIYDHAARLRSYEIFGEVMRGMTI